MNAPYIFPVFGTAVGLLVAFFVVRAGWELNEYLVVLWTSHLRNRPYRLVFLAAFTVSGLTYWWNADWWVYAQDNPPWPKFEMPVWWQILKSSTVGLVAAIPVMVVVRLGCSLVARGNGAPAERR
jgi:hypothetical protein